MPIADIKPALENLLAKSVLYETLWDYYEGEQELKFSTLKLQKFFSGKGIYFAENWMGVVIDAVLDRLSLQGFSVAKQTQATDVLKQAFNELKLGLVAFDLHESALVVTEAFYILEKLPDGRLDGYLQDASTCDVVYDQDNPNIKKFAIKFWYEDAKTVRVNLYYPNITERYQAEVGKRVKISQTNFEQLESLDNPFKVIPVFHFRTTQQGRQKPLLSRALRSLQDAVNIQLSNMMISSEFNSLRQRVIISQSDPSDLKNVPGENWWIPSGDGTGQQASVQELGNFDPTSFITSIDHLSSAIAAQTKTPKHYFFSLAGQVPSGEALNALESPLVKKTLRFRDNFEVTWKEIASFLLQLAGTQIPASEVTSQWSTVQTTQPKTEAETIKTSVDSTIPLKTALRRNGWSEEELIQLDNDRKEEQSNKTSLTKTILDELRVQDSQNNENLGEGDGTAE